MSKVNRKITRKKTAQRRYDSAIRDRLTSDWTTTNRSADAELRTDLLTLRARSRDLFRNSDHMRRFVNMSVANIVGHHGFTLQIRGQNTNGELDQVGNDFLESDFMEWCDDCEVTGRLSFREVCKLMVRTLIIDGEFLALKIDGADNDDRFKLQILDPDLLDYYRNEVYGATGNQVRMGVEYDRTGKPVAYHLRESHPNDATYAIGDQRIRRVDAEQVIHIFITERVGQSRGVPAAASAMQRLNNLRAYEHAAVLSKRVAASKMGFFTRNDEDQGYEGDLDSDEALIYEAEAGVFEELPNGVSFTAFDPSHDSTGYAEFVKATLRGIASGLNVNYIDLANDLEGVNYSSIRAGILQDRETWQALQEFIIDSFLKPLFKHWLRNHLTFNSRLPVSTFDKFKRHLWQARRWSWVDPQKDINASVMAIENGLKTRAQVIRESGLDPHQVWNDLAKEKEKLIELGILSNTEQVIDNEEQNDT